MLSKAVVRERSLWTPGCQGRIPPIRFYWVTMDRPVADNRLAISAKRRSILRPVLGKSTLANVVDAVR
jgi:hypothetical protein